ncbi:hypothetical protein L1987_44281 [Smallanthus sonchifolius]|uniref:Uncharacterized protein n=1 Tax=Smallanthus sonchifolius TaxID=185202 RepID=A0ACB9GNR9_9ASTR|nr:hypothetical protein L1987_44281 [Smallanthus sonchifolius]
MLQSLSLPKAVNTILITPGFDAGPFSGLVNYDCVVEVNGGKYEKDMIRSGSTRRVDMEEKPETTFVVLRHNFYILNGMKCVWHRGDCLL